MMCRSQINEENESEIVAAIYGETTGAGEASPVMLVAAPR